MSRMISADGMAKRIDKLFELGDFDGSTYELLMRIVDTAVDAVEVVRCKDCKFNWDTTVNHGKMHPKCDFTDYLLTENDYCSKGERRTDE